MAGRDSFFLWHLEHAGIIERSGNAWAAPLWEAASSADPVPVAIVDTGLDTRHPNLAGAMQVPQIDFGPRINGAVYDPVGSATKQLRRLSDDPAAPADAFAAPLTEALGEAVQQSARLGLDISALTAIVDSVATGTDARTAAQTFLKALRVPVADRLPFPSADWQARLSGLGLTAAQLERLEPLTEGFANGLELLPVEDPSDYFGAHGTGCAGLVGGRPPAEGSHPFFGALPYRGVNPFCHLIPVASPYSHEIRPVTNALLTAYLLGAKVILFPRGLPDMARRKALPESRARATRIDHPSADPVQLVPEDQAVLERLEEEAGLFEALLGAISQKCYVVLASGNDGFHDRLAYPASAVAGDPNPVIVAATNRNGQPSSYSNGNDLTDRVLTMVSDDGPVVDRERFRIDTTTREGTDFGLGPDEDDLPPNDYSPWAPLSLDITGPYGNASSSQDDPPLYDDGIDVRSLYALFGGTSAAASMAAGLISLLLQSGKFPADRILTAAEVRQVMQTEAVGPFAGS